MYAQIKDGAWREIPGNVVFSPTVYQTAASLTDDQRSEFGVYLIVDEQPSLPVGHVWGEHQWNIDGSTVIRTWVPAPMTNEQLAAQAEIDLAAAKAARQAQVNAITVTTPLGTFDGNEDAQRRMTSAITAMDEGDTLPWVLNDSTVVTVNKSDLRLALRMAGAAMAAIWVAPYAQP